MVMGGDNVIDVSQRLNQLMEERGMTTYALAKAANVSWNTVKNYSLRNTKPTLATLCVLCEGLGITLAQFFDSDGVDVQLTSEQQHVLNRWSKLSVQEKQVISDMLDIIISKKD